MNIDKTEDLTKLRPFIFSAVRKVAGKKVAPDELEDLVQDVYLELLAKKLEQYDPNRGMEMSTYVTMIATRHTIDKMRRLRDVQSMETPVSIKRSTYNTGQGQPVTLGDKLDTMRAMEMATALEGLIKHEHGEQLKEAIAKMSNGDQKFLARLMDDDYDTEDHARDLGISANAVYVKKCRLVAKLRAKLQK